MPRDLGSRSIRSGAMKKSTVRRRLSLFAVLALLFAQLSLSAYACALALADDSAQPTAVVAAGADCHGQAAIVSSDVPCAFHCQNSTTVASSPLPALSPDQSAPPLIVELPSVCWSQTLAWRRDAVLAMTTAPPVSERFCRFLI